MEDACDLPSGRRSFITRVLGFDGRRFRGWQARWARSRQIAQVPDALLRGFGCPTRNAARRCCNRSARGPACGGRQPSCRRFLVEAFIAEATVEGLDVAVLLRLAGIDVMPLNLVVVRPFEDGLAGELGAVVRHDAGRFTVDANQGVQFARHPDPRDAGIGDQAEVFTAAVIVRSQKPFHGSADYRDGQRAGGWLADGRVVPLARAEPCDVLQAEGQVWRDGPVRCQTPQAA